MKHLQQALDIGRNSAYDLIRENKIYYFKIGTTIKIPKLALLDYVFNEGSCYNYSRNGWANTAVRKENNIA
jgi:hypothetical protein